MTESLIGQKIGKYEITEHLGRGGMAEVYKGYQESLERDVAIKLMHAFLIAEQDFLQRFKREAKAMAAMNHPHIVQVYDFDLYGKDTYYLVMEYIKGETLKDLLTDLAAKGERLPLERTVQIVLEIASALEYAHKRGMIHRDIKPANIMIEEGGRAVLSDFGIVKMIGGTQSMAHTMTGALIGTPAYMAPEQALGKPGDERGDIYSLGVLLFQMVTGKLPFDADTPLAVVMKHVNEPAPLPVSFNPDTPFRLQEIILKSMAKDPNYRYQSAREMAAALKAVEVTGDYERATLVSPIQDDQHTMSSAAQNTAAGRTQLTPMSGATAVIPPSELPNTATSTGTIAPPPASLASTIPVWAYAVGAVVLLLILWAGAKVFGPPPVEPEPSATAVVALVATNTLVPETTSTATPIPVTPQDTPDLVATMLVAARATENAQPTNTPTATTTPTATPINTPDATATFLADCTVGVELVTAHTYQNGRNNIVFVQAPFPMYWDLKNSGTCPWPADLVWQYKEGERLGYNGTPVPLSTAVAGGGEITLSAPLIAPRDVKTYSSVWELTNPEGTPYGTPISFELRTAPPVTPTPTRPPASPTPAASPTSATSDPVGWIYLVKGTCVYEVGDWSCPVEITPYGGGGGPYTVLVFDQAGGGSTQFRGPWPVYYQARARRCAAANFGVRIIDDASGKDLYDNLYVDPNNYFPGGCTLP